MRALSLSVLMLLLACSEGTSDASSITYARVLGVRVEVDADAQRATPRWDESATFTVLVRGPLDDTAVTYALELCIATPDNGALPACAGPPLLTSAPTEATTTPTLHWPGLATAPSADARELLLRGTVCEQGRPSLDPTRPGQCVDPEFVGVSFVSRVTLLVDDQDVPNHHPSLNAATVTIDNAAWNPGDCGVRAARDGKEHTLSIALNDANRETLDATPETLLLSWFTNAGELNQHFSVLEGEQAEDAPLTITWTAPTADTPINNESATFTGVLRDQRGGIAITTRNLCWN